MKIKKKILLILVITLFLICAVVAALWYRSSEKLTNAYQEDVSETSMRDACNAFNYLLTDTSYMATLVATNEKNIIDPVGTLNTEILMRNGQWNQAYLENRRLIMDYITSLNGHKYYIAGIAVIANRDCIFNNSHVVEYKQDLYDRIALLDQNALKYSMVMMETLHLEGSKSTISSDYVLPGVRGIVNRFDQLIGYVVVYFDYGVIEQMFSDYMPDGSFFQVVNESGALIFSNTGEWIDIDALRGKYAKNTFFAENVGWTFSLAVPSDHYVADIRHSAWTAGVWMAVIVTIAGTLSMLLVSKSISEIAVLQKQIEVISNGNLSARYQVKSHDEIGQVGAAFNRMVDRLQELMQKIALDEREKRLSELAFLQAQINPHFVSNVLNNVAWMAKLQHADNIVPLVNSLNALLRNVIHQEHALIPLQDELDYVDNYLTIMGYSGSYDFAVERDLAPDAVSLYVPRFILQPIIENTIVHGLPEDLSRQGCIRIQAVRTEKILRIIIEDNGRGMTPDEIQKLMSGKKRTEHSLNGIGVTNVNERIHLYYGESYGLHYESEPGRYTRCIITLPVVEEDAE